jgi:hypothetical protein
MKRFLSAILLASVALSACQQGRSSGNETAAAAKPGPAATRAAAPAPQQARAALPSDCAPEPKLALGKDFADPRKAFAPDAPAFRQTAVHFDAAWRKACAAGMLRGHPLMEPGAAQPDTLFLKNAPDANVAAIYRDGDDSAPPAGRVMVLEYFFLPADGANHVPTADELGEAIFCATQGASQGEEEGSGRCLVD